jgi:hypothetical protein
MNSTLDIIKTKGETEPGRDTAFDDSTGVQSQALGFNAAAYANAVRPKGFLYLPDPNYSGPVSNSRTFNAANGAVHVDRVERLAWKRWSVTWAC